jgi:GNAT superfamily N-acetyltransferase
VTEGALPLDFRDMTESDLADGLRLSRASGWNQTLDDWRLLLTLGPGLFRVGVEEGRVVASGGAVRYGDALAWICMILVDPARRGHGFGTRVFDEVLDRCAAEVRAGRLRSVGLDATPAGHGIYRERGFVDGPSLVRLRREPGDAPPPPEGVVSLDASALDAVLARDRAVFGADRGAVLRWAHASAPDLAFGTHAGAWCFGRHGDHSDHVGPVVAGNRESALAVVRACVARPRIRPLVLDARVEPSWLAALAELGFREQRPFTRMYLGEARPDARPAEEPAVFGPEFG